MSRSYADQLQQAYEEQLGRANRLEAARDRSRETMLRCAEKLETPGNDEVLLVAKVLRAEAGKRS